MTKSDVMIKVEDEVETTRQIQAGLDEQGPVICEEGTRGTVTSIESKEPDGIEVRLTNGATWWFKPNQLRKRD
jgi:hypothetical protein